MVDFWKDVNLKQPQEKEFVVVKTHEGNKIFAKFHCGQGEGWFISNGKEVRATLWKSLSPND